MKVSTKHVKKLSGSSTPAVAKVRTFAVECRDAKGDYYYSEFYMPNTHTIGYLLTT